MLPPGGIFWPVSCAVSTLQVGYWEMLTMSHSMHSALTKSIFHLYYVILKFILKAFICEVSFSSSIQLFPLMACHAAFALRTVTCHLFIVTHLRNVLIDHIFPPLPRPSHSSLSSYVKLYDWSRGVAATFPPNLLSPTESTHPGLIHPLNALPFLFSYYWSLPLVITKSVHQYTQC